LNALAITLRDVGPFLGPVISLALLAGLNWARRQIEARIDRNKTEFAALLSSHQDRVVAEIKAIRIDLARLNEDVTEHGDRLNAHGERLAWLEGKAGKPLGSTPLPREKEP
jgi:hypothetical protein